MKSAFVDFTKEMKQEYTILAPDIFPTHMELLASIFRNEGYHLDVLHYENRKVIDTGLKYLHNDMCYPAICTVGQQLYALTCGDYDPHKVALIQFQTGGGCRASNYIWLLRKALERMGMEYVPVISLSFSGMEHYSGFQIKPRMIFRAIQALIYGDMLLLLKNQVRPYEKVDGDTDKLVAQWIERLSKQLAQGGNLSSRKMKNTLSEIAADFHSIPRVSKTLKKVGIVGEIYVKYSSFGNNGLEAFLASQGCEYMVPGVLGFFQYCFSNMSTDYHYYGGLPFAKWAGNFALRVSMRMEKDIRAALAPYPEFAIPASFRELRRLSAQIIDPGVKMGEGWLLPGETAELIEKGYNNVVCAQPFGCLPNHIVGKGTIRRLREIYPNANIFPVDYDAGASKVNQENRLKLMLAIAEDERSEDA